MCDRRQHLLVLSARELVALRGRDNEVASLLLTDAFWAAKFKHHNIPFPIHIRYLYCNDAELKLEAYLCYCARYEMLERKQSKGKRLL